MFRLQMRRLIEAFKHKLSIFKRPEIYPFHESESDIENVYEPDQLLDSDEEGDKEEDVEISILLKRKNHSTKTFGFCLNEHRLRISTTSK